MSYADFEPLLTDERVGRIAELLLMAYPGLGQDAEIFTFVVEPQTVPHRGRRFPHERGCAVARQGECDCGPYTVPEQAVFAIRTPHPRAGFDPIYRGRQLMSQAAMLRSVWDAAEKRNKHFVSTREDPAWAPFQITAQNHLRQMKDYRELI